MAQAFSIINPGDRNLRDLVGVSLTNGLGGEKEGTTVVAEAAHCD